MPVAMKEQAALTALRDEFRKIFEPFGGRVEQIDVQMSGRSLRWRSRTPDYPAHHVGGAFEDWSIAAGRPNKQHRIVIVIVRDESLLDPRNAAQHCELFEARWMPERLFQAKIPEIAQAFGIALVDPVITVLPAASIWNSR
jgi:hypothetical protein